MTPQEKYILIHALGLDNMREVYRSHFAAAPGTDDAATCDALKSKGYMTSNDTPRNHFGGLIFYYVTLEGAEAVGVTKAEFEKATT